MRKVILPILVFSVAMFVAASPSFGQGSAKTGPASTILRDADLEKDSLHNLEVARHYFKLKKAYVAAIKRCEEIDAGNPTFSKLDEVLYIAGASSLRLAENRGKQKPKEKTPTELRQDARVYFSRLAVEFPNSAFSKQIAGDLQALGGPIEPEGSKP